MTCSAPRRIPETQSPEAMRPPRDLAIWSVQLLEFPLDLCQRDSSRASRTLVEEVLESTALPQRLYLPIEIVRLGQTELLAVRRYQQHGFLTGPVEHRRQIDILLPKIYRFHSGTCFPRTSSTLRSLCPIEVTTTV